MRRFLVVTLLCSLAAVLTPVAAAATTATATTSQIAHFAPPGGSTAACLAPALAKLKAGYPLHKETQSLAAMQAALKAAAPCSGTTVITTATTTSDTSCINCFATFSMTSCDNALTCYVAPTNFTANWSETLTVRFEYRLHDWVEGGSAFPGTYTRTDEASVPLWSVSSECGSECFVWNFARAYGDPGYILARDNYSVTFLASWFGTTWHLRNWMNCYPGGYVETGEVGSTL